MSEDGPHRNRCKNCSNWLAADLIAKEIDVESVKARTGTDLSIFAKEGIGMCTVQPMWLPCAPDHWCKRFWSS